jgi:hypothetical protein
MDPKENPLPEWMRLKKAEDVPSPELDPVEAFKRDPDSFFPNLTGAKNK